VFGLEAGERFLGVILDGRGNRGAEGDAISGAAGGGGSASVSGEGAGNGTRGRERSPRIWDEKRCAVVDYFAVQDRASQAAKAAASISPAARAMVWRTACSSGGWKIHPLISRNNAAAIRPERLLPSRNG